MIWQNNKFIEQGSIDPSDRGFTLGDGLFETILVYRGQPIFLEEHLQRLKEGVSLLGIKLPSNIQDGVKALLANRKTQEASLRITLTRGVQKPGLWPSSASPPANLVIALHDYERDDRPRTYHIAQERRYSTSILSRIKSLNYLPQILAQREAVEKGYDEALMLNEFNRLVCSARANLFLVKDKTLITPPLSEGVLPGIMREKILNLAGQIDLTFLEQKLFPTDLDHADEIFFTNSLMLIQPLGDKATKYSPLFQHKIWHQVKETNR